ncbi:DAPG hydrolase family protein [Butyricicoccus sp.]|uniref:DAPG hydrolase family protein n=1 Tax=Butyricicoccus sp. TaxID=2049021 RepID=UPI003F1461AB
MKDLLKKPLPVMPEDIREKLEQPDITLTAFEKKNEILRDPMLQQEVGYRKMEDGSYLVSMVCPMPGITPEMIQWWFWWHPQKPERYQIWYPGDHISIDYSKKQAEYFEQPSCPEFQDNTQNPVERIGGLRMPLRIDFVTPEEFGFSREEMCKHNIPLMVCGHVGLFNGLIWHTEMAHIYKQTDDGLFLISRFWLGRTMNPLLRKLIITDKMAKGMAEHCCIEYRNLWEILPGLYHQYGRC